MFSKKKSLAKIAKVRSKKEASPPQEVVVVEKEEKVEIKDKVVTVSTTTNRAPEAKEEELEEEELLSPSKRFSLDSSGNNNSRSLQVPISRQTSISTPNLAEAANTPPPTPKQKIRLFRNPLLKSASGSLHDEATAQQPHSFDHDFDGRSSSPIMNMARNLLKKNVKEDIANSMRNPLHSPRRTQSVRVTPIVRVEDEEGKVTRGAAATTTSTLATSPPVRIPNRSRSLRHPRRKPEYPVPNPNHVSPTDSMSPSDDDSDGEYYNEDMSVYCTPPKKSSVVGLDPFRSRKESVTKSRSMNSLLCDDGQLDPLGLSLAAVNTVCAHQARTRSYLLGSVGATSLLGPQELEKCFPENRTLRLFVGTWNMNGKAPPRHLADFLLPKNIEFVPDILVVATQESFPERNEWEVRLQDTLGPSHVLFHSSGMGTLHLCVFLRRDLIWYCSVPETDSFNARPGTQFRTKGAVAVAFLLFGTSFLFINSHLTAHEENSKDRIRDYKKITAMLNLPRELPARSARHREISDKFDCVFWCGDLNFRLAQSREVVIQEVSNEENALSILEFDQLNFLRREGFIFRGYQESEINFPPTYKYDVGTNDFDTSSKQRTPSYTDRILYKSQRSTPVKPVHYDSVQDVLTSDHRPVWGIWEVKLRPGRDTVPLAGGLFNREVYLDGLKRRVEALQPVLSGKDGASNYMCSLQ